jgi:hypothetical protein
MKRIVRGVTASRRWKLLRALERCVYSAIMVEILLILFLLADL